MSPYVPTGLITFEDYSGVRVDGANSPVVPSTMPLDARAIAPSTPQMAVVRHFFPQYSLECGAKQTLS